LRKGLKNAIDERRREVGLSTLEENTKRIHAEDELLSDEA